MNANTDRENRESSASSFITPQEDIVVKFAFSSVQIDESYLSTLFSVKEMHTAPLVDSDDYRVVITLAYLDPVEHPALAKKFRIVASKQTIKSNVSPFIQLYMSSEVAGDLLPTLQNASSSPAGVLNTTAIDGINLYLPKSKTDLYEYTDEHLCLQLDAWIFDGECIKLTFLHYASIKREEDVMHIIEEFAKRPDIVEIYQKTHQMVSKLIEITDFNPKTNLLFNDPMEMMESYIGLKRLGNGFVEEKKDGKLHITIDAESSARWVSVMSHLLTKNP